MATTAKLSTRLADERAEIVRILERHDICVRLQGMISPPPVLGRLPSNELIIELQAPRPAGHLIEQGRDWLADTSREIKDGLCLEDIIVELAAVSVGEVSYTYEALEVILSKKDELLSVDEAQAVIASTTIALAVLSKKKQRAA